MAEATGPFANCVRAVMDEYLDAVDAAGARVSITRADQRAVTIYSTAGEGWATEPVPTTDPGTMEVGPRRIVFGKALGNEMSAVVELLAAPNRPFTFDLAQAARSGGEVLGIWLAGMSVGATQYVGDRKGVLDVPVPFEDTIQGELSRAKRLSLSGGLLVASVPGAAVPDPAVMSVVIQTLRDELRSADLLGQLATGDIAAVLVRANADGVARAADRVRHRLDTLVRAHQVPPIVVGHALYPAGAGESPASLVARARREAGLVFS